MVMNQYAGRFSVSSFEKKTLRFMRFFHLTKVMYPKSNPKYTRVVPVNRGLLL